MHGVSKESQEYDDERDAEDAIKALDGTELDGARIIVEQCHGGRKGRDRDDSNNECFNCGGRGHWYVVRSDAGQH